MFRGTEVGEECVCLSSCLRYDVFLIPVKHRHFQTYFTDDDDDGDDDDDDDGKNHV